MYRCAQCVTTHTEQNDHISSREHAWLKIAHLCVPKELSSTCHVSFLAAPDNDHKHKLSHLPHLSFRRFHQHTQDLWRTIHIYPAKFHGRVADQHKSHLSHVELIERFITAGFRCCSRWLENAASDCVCFVARLLSSSCTPLSSMLKPVIWIVITTSSDCESCFVAARRLFLFFDLGHSCPVRRILTFIVNSGRDSSVCSGLENCHRCCAAPRILATSRNLVSAATLPERGSCGLFAAAVLPYEVLALQLAMLFHPLWLRSSHPMWVRSSCSFAVTVVDHPSRRPVPQASSFRRQRTSFPRSSLPASYSGSFIMFLVT